MIYLVTGGTSGIGRAVVERVLADSTDNVVYATYGHSDDAANDLLTHCRSCYGGDRLNLIKIDMSKRDSISQLCTHLEDALEGRMIDRLVLNVGVGTYKPFSEYDFSDWDRVMDTNLTIPVFLIQSMMKNLLARGCSIVLMSSLMASCPHSRSIVYGASKAALSLVSRSLVKELEPKGIRINAVAPGFIQTRWQDDRTEESYARINAKIAEHRFGSPEEVADAVIFSLENAYINGTSIAVDGGYDYF